MRRHLSGGLKLVVALVLFLHGMPSVFAAQETGVIDKIRFIGNKVTKERVLRQEMLVSEGDPVDLGKIEKSRLAIMNLGLFKSVEAGVVEEEGANVLLITLDERYYILPLPLLDARLEEETFSYGMELRFDNLMGLNQRLKLTYENKKSVNGDTPTQKEASVSYSYPRIGSSANNLSINGKVIRNELEERVNNSVTGSYLLDNRSAGFGVSRWLDPGISQGWLVGAGMSVGQTVYTEKKGTAEKYRDSQTMELNFGLDYAAVQEFPYNREGSAYGYNIGIAFPEIGSDYSYSRHLFYHRNYHALPWVDANLNTQVIAGVANGETVAFSLGGGSSLRGYESGVASGNAMLQINAEYHQHVSGYRQLRGVVFMDVGNAWPGAMEVELDKLLPSVGLGMRWRVQSFVDVTLRLDAAYALDTQATKIYASTSSSF